MGAVRIAGDAYITKGPPWARRFGGLKLGRLGYPPGTLPAHLKKFLLTTEPRKCADETKDKSGVNRVLAMNVCIARLRGK